MRDVAILVGALAVGVCWPVSTAAGQDTVDTVEASVGFLPCTPVGVDGPVPWGLTPGYPQPRRADEAPGLTVVITEIRPDRARLYLDDRYIGRADDFDGHPDALYLEPGTYVLEARLGGYRTDRFDLVADAGCRHDIRHWLDRVRSEPVEGVADGPPAPFPLERVFGPVEAVASDHERGADTRSRTTAEVTAPAVPPTVVLAPDRATLRLRVTPLHASVTLDGEFLATGRELARVQGGLAVEVGHRIVEVSAPGYRTVTLELDLVAGAVTAHDVALDPDARVTDNTRD